MGNSSPVGCNLWKQHDAAYVLTSIGVLGVAGTVGTVFTEGLATAGPKVVIATLCGWLAFVAAVALVLQFIFVAPAGGKLSQARDVNTNPSLIWREDEGVSKLSKLTPATPKGKQLSIYTMAEVAKHNTREDLWIIIDAKVYDVTKFVDAHPGGVSPLLNMAGKDCTDVFANYHAARIYEKMLPTYLVGDVGDVEEYKHVSEFRAVRQELLRLGLFETDYRFYAKHGTWLVMVFTGALWLSLGCSSTAAHLAGAASMGLFWQQLAGLGHDLGHSGVSHRFRDDHWLGSLLAGLMGLSTCWWKMDHNTHHIVCNSVEHDPNIQHMPTLAISPAVFKKPYYSSFHERTFGMDLVAKWLVSYQHITFYPIMFIAGRWNIYVMSWLFVLCPPKVHTNMHFRKLEICTLSFYWTWLLSVILSFSTWKESIAWVLTSHAVAGFLHLQIVVSHWSMETYHGHAYTGKDDEWYITQLKTSMNVDTPLWLDWAHIGLQFQIEHHLFPRLPRHNLREARKLIRPLCNKHGIKYVEPNCLESQKDMWLALRSAAMVARTSKRGVSGFFESSIWEGMNLAG